jgi:hypothetical protein
LNDLTAKVAKVFAKVAKLVIQKCNAAQGRKANNTKMLFVRFTFLFTTLKYFPNWSSLSPNLA